MKLFQAKAAGIVLAALLGVFAACSPAMAGPTYSLDLVPDTGSSGSGLFTLNTAPPLSGWSGDLSGSLSAFSITIDSYTFNLTNGSVSFLQFRNNSVSGFDYTGSIGTGLNKVSLTIHVNFVALLNSYKLTKGILGGTTLATGSLAFDDPAPVPEPPSALLLVSGLVLLGGGWWLQRRQSQLKALSA